MLSTSPTLDSPVSIDADDSELRVQCRERIVRDFGSCRRERARQRRLAGVGCAEESDVGKQLEREVEPARLARLARLRPTRRAIRAALEARVPFSAFAPLGDEQYLADVGQVAELLACVDVGDPRPVRHLDI